MAETSAAPQLLTSWRKLLASDLRRSLELRPADSMWPSWMACGHGCFNIAWPSTTIVPRFSHVFSMWLEVLCLTRPDRSAPPVWWRLRLSRIQSISIAGPCVMKWLWNASGLYHHIIVIIVISVVVTYIIMAITYIIARKWHPKLSQKSSYHKNY